MNPKETREIQRLAEELIFKGWLGNHLALVMSRLF